jgi:hypothetical protein
MKARLKTWPVAVGQALASGLGAVLAVVLVGDSVWCGLTGAVVGLLAALGAEYVVRLHLDAHRLRDAPRQLEAERAAREEARRLCPYLLVVERRRLAVSEATFKVYADALREVDPQGQRLPSAALMARVQVTLQGQGLDKPLPPLDECKPPPPGQPL